VTPGLTPGLTVGLTLALLLSGCGSTAQQTSTSTVAGDGLGGTASGQGLGGSSDVGAPTGAAVGSAPGTGSGGTAPGGGAVLPTQAAGTATGAATSEPLPRQAATGLGVTAKTISIGIGYASDGDAANAAIGAAGLTTGDEKANSQALVDEVNAHGGVAGRRLVPVFHAYHVTSASSGSSQDEAACQDWTVDHKVLAVFSSSLTDTLVACLQQRGVVYVKGGQIVDSDQAYLQKYSNEVLTSTMTQDRVFKDQVTSLVRQQWFGGWSTVNGTASKAPAKVGVLTYDTDSFDRALHHVLLPALAAAGHAPAAQDVIQVHKVQQQSDAAQTSAQIKAAVLKLQSDRVTHLVLGDASGFILEIFGSNARSQGYYPRLGVTSGTAVQAIYDNGLVTAQQVRGMAGNGWLPTIDIPATESNRYAGAQTRRCLSILQRRTGQTYSSSNAATIALGDCDGIFLFQKGLAAAPSLSPAGLLAGIDSHGSSYESPVVGPTYVSPRQHDTAVRAWDLNWVQSCTCVRYTAERRVPSL
jgi:hypothetical protein